MANRRRNDAEAFVEEAERQGWKVKKTRRGWLCFPPNGQDAAVYVAGTAQDRRSLTNALAALRRAGFRWPPP